MRINSINPLSFNGLYEPLKKFNKESGAYNRNKLICTMYEHVYHPYKDELPEVTEAALKNIMGRHFSIWDKFDNHHKADMMHLDLVQIGSPIEHEEADKYISLGWHEMFIGINKDDKEFWETYNNAAYAPFDIYVMDAAEVKAAAKRHFDSDV